MSETEFDVLIEVPRLIDDWCERRDLAPLARLLPAWQSNLGLTDAWADVLAALETVRASCTLPKSEMLVVERSITALHRAVCRT